jgi:member of the syntaxin family of t-SNAREs
MDPFSQVYADAEEELATTQRFLKQYQTNPNNNNLLDLNNSAQNLTETIHDLSQSIGVVQSRPSQYGLSHYEIEERITKVGRLNSQLADIQAAIPKVKQVHPNVNTWSASEENRATGATTDADATAAAQSMVYQDIIEEQDTVLDSVYTTVTSLRDQANVMSRELEDQSYLIEDFDRQVDTAGDKLRRGIKKVDWVVRNNRETLSSCCITLLIVVLIVLLVLVLVL